MKLTEGAQYFKLTDEGREYVEAMPDKKAMAKVKRKYAKLKKAKKLKGE